MSPSLPPSFLTTGLFTLLLACAGPLSAADEHAGHDHAGHDHGTTAPVGSVAISPYQVAVAAAGAVAAGKDWHVELRLTPDQPAPKAIRLWVGIENGRGSAKAKATPEAKATGEYTAHVDVPNPLPPTSRLWIAIEPDSGPVVKSSLALPGNDAPGDHGHDHGGHDDHQH